MTDATGTRTAGFRWPWQNHWEPPIYRYTLRGPNGGQRTIMVEAGEVVLLRKDETLDLLSREVIREGRWVR